MIASDLKDQKAIDAVRLNQARTASVLADVVRTLDVASGDHARQFEAGEAAASMEAANLTSNVIGAEVSSSEPMTIAVASELLAQLAYRKRDWTSAVKHAEQARSQFLELGQLSGVETTERLLGLTSAAGYVRAQVVRTIDADVVACDEQGRLLASSPPEKGRCELVFVDAGNLQLRVAITDAAPVDPEQVEQIRTLLQSQAVQEKQILKIVESAENADWLVQISVNRILLMPADTGVLESGDSEQTPLNGIGPHAIDSTTANWLAQALQRIARAANLKKIAADESRATKTGESVRIELSVEKQDTPQPIDDATRHSLKDGDRISVRVRNPCQFPVDVTLLFIDSQQGIDALFPQRGEINRLLAGDSISIPTRVAADKPGLEHLVAIAVKSQREVMDFTCLTQIGIDKTRGDSDDTTLNSPLGQLLNHAVLSGSATRGLKQTSVKAHCMKLVSLEIQP